MTIAFCGPLAQQHGFGSREFFVGLLRSVGVSEDLQALAVELPKAELHVHLEGSIEPQVAQRLAERHDLAVPVDPATGRWLPLRDFHDFIRCYLAISSCLQTEDDVCFVVEDYARRCAAQGIRYAEVTFTPMTHIARGVAPEALMWGLAHGRAFAKERYGVHLRWVFDIVRTFPDQAEPTLSFAFDVNRNDASAVVGLGLAGLETDADNLAAFMFVFGRAKAEGLKSLPHAGELAGPRSIHAALTLLDADRIGHGIRCLEDPELVAILADREVPLEICPTSNIRLAGVSSLAAHPLPRLLEAGVRVCLASDDPGIFGVDLVHEYVACAKAFGWSAEDLRRLARESMRHAPPELQPADVEGDDPDDVEEPDDLDDDDDLDGPPDEE